MDFLELAKKRYSARKYDGKKVEDDKLGKILEAARVAPSGSNKQPVKLLVLKDEEELEKVSKAASRIVAMSFCEPRSW